MVYRQKNTMINLQRYYHDIFGSVVVLEAKFCVLGLEGPVLGLGLALSVQALALVSGVITNYTLEVEKSQSTNIVIHSVLTGQLTNQI